MGGEVEAQLIHSEVQRHQLGKGRVGHGSLGLDGRLEGEIQPRKKGAGLQGLRPLVSGRILTLHGNIRIGQGSAGAGKDAAALAAGLVRSIHLQGRFLL